MMRLASILSQLHKILYDLESDGSGLLGMELHAVCVAAFEYRCVWRGVGASGRGLRSYRDVVAVGEIDEGVGGHTREQLHRTLRLQRIPAHVRHASVPGEALHRARIDAQAVDLGSFFTVFKESLQAETDPEER